MQYFILLFAALAVPALAFSQVIVVSGYATNFAAAPGVYSTPSMPVVSTPSATFWTPPLQVGATNATEGNVAGASAMISGEATVNSTALDRSARGAFNTGASMPQEAFGVAELVGGKTQSRPAVRKFSNSDVEQLHAADPR